MSCMTSVRKKKEIYVSMNAYACFVVLLLKAHFSVAVEKQLCRSKDRCIFILPVPVQYFSTFHEGKALIAMYIRH